MRYDRQALMLGEKGQDRLKNSKVCVIGAGGLGSVVLYYLTASGIGNIKVVDYDEVKLDNLNRQFIHFTEDIGKSKVESAKDKLNRLNPDIKIEILKIKIIKGNIKDIIKDCDVIVDCLDNIETRLIVSDACKSMKKNFVFGAVEEFRGMQGTNLDLRKIYKEENKRKFQIIGATVGVIGSLEALETIKLILGLKVNKNLLIFDGKNNKFKYIKIKKEN